MTPVEDPAIVFASAQLILLLYLGIGRSCLPSVQTCSIGERSGDLAGHVGRHILEDHCWELRAVCGRALSC
ncbi:hypothetical protein TNCV_654751 [Trichonephila clavipes]|nr:hypothetical protein TNCV_654751 [Trichonephila clavipes]